MHWIILQRLQDQYSGSFSLSLQDIKKLYENMLTELWMIDVWRELHPTDRQYTFYSASHRVHSRIDYFFTYNSDRYRLRECSIRIRDVSDHSPVYLILHLDNKKKNKFWRLNTSILNDNACKNYVQKEFKDYMDNNNNGEVLPSVVREVLSWGFCLANFLFYVENLILLSFQVNCPSSCVTGLMCPLIP